MTRRDEPTTAPHNRGCGELMVGALLALGTFGGLLAWLLGGMS